MRLQKIEELKRSKMWQGYETPFKNKTEIDFNNPNFGVNVYFAGAAVETRKKIPDYLRLLDLTSTHINAGGWGCIDFVVSLTNEHQTCKLIESRPVENEYVLGFIRLDAGGLNNAPLSRFLEQPKMTGEFTNATLLNGKIIVPTQPFGNLLRGGKLIALLAASNELKELWNKRHNRNIAVFYTQSLYGTSKSSSQYDQLDRYMQYIGDTDGKSYPLRIRDPQKKQLIDWLDERGISRYQFTFKGSSKADKSHAELIKYVGECIRRKRSRDDTCNQLSQTYIREMNLWKSGKTERKRTYVSTYGFDDWKDNISAIEMTTKPEYDLAALFAYWKKKVFKEKSWGIRKSIKNRDSNLQLRYELLNDQLKHQSFNQVR